jgi:hypothetical protein
MNCRASSASGRRPCVGRRHWGHARGHESSRRLGWPWFDHLVITSGLKWRSAAVALAVSLAAACAATRPPLSVIQSGPDGLRTFTWVREAGGAPVLCNAAAAVNPVTGVLRGDPAASAQPLWLETGSGRRMSVVWPAGFTVRFEPDATLRNENGTVVGRDGDRIRLPQVGAQEHAGTFEDPYVASGLVFDGCYPFFSGNA